MMRMDSVGNKTWPAHKPEKHNHQQRAESHGQSGQKPDLLLMFGQAPFSPANVVVLHNFLILSRHRRIRRKVFKPWRLSRAKSGQSGVFLL